VLYYQHEVTDVDLFYWLTAPLGESVLPIVSSLSDNLEILRITGTKVPQN
jgi:hypothetical protein